MRKSAILICAGLLALSLAACANNDTKPTGASTVTLGGATSTPTPEATQAPDEVVMGKFVANDCKVVVNGVTLKLAEDFLPNVDNVGKLMDKQEGQACLDGGYDTEYYYDGMVVSTIAKSGKQIITSVDVTLTGYTDAKKIKIGTSTEADVIAAYGNPDVNEMTRREYKAGDYSLVFYIENDVVTEIEIVDTSIS